MVLSCPTVARRWIPVLSKVRIDVGLMRAASLMTLTACCWSDSFVCSLGETMREIEHCERIPPGPAFGALLDLCMYREANNKKTGCRSSGLGLAVAVIVSQDCVRMQYNAYSSVTYQSHYPPSHVDYTQTTISSTNLKNEERNVQQT